ncbi:hypothetical protein SEA_SIRVICTOR_41 [Microbacterium phage SirVictor]|nr:hypothetical protein SEA_SIRVICTOR_41 [Microbacterium phage SirVictor]WNM74384.1 hypothetical protein SEA_GUETZIE_41 [Microbacterium phage Guetzie]
MDLEKEFRLVLERIAIQANRRYMEALAHIYQVDIRTVFIWHATGRV